MHDTVVNEKKTIIFFNDAKDFQANYYVPSMLIPSKKINSWILFISLALEIARLMFHISLSK